MDSLGHIVSSNEVGAKNAVPHCHLEQPVESILETGKARSFERTSVKNFRST